MRFWPNKTKYSLHEEEKGIFTLNVQGVNDSSEVGQQPQLLALDQNEEYPLTTTSSLQGSLSDSQPHIFRSPIPVGNDAVGAQETGRGPPTAFRESATLEGEEQIEQNLLETERELIKDLPKRPELEITFFDIGYDVPSWNVKRCCWNKTTVIDGVSGVFYAKELTAIMGPSGAGKTTLLNAVSGFRVTNVRGSIMVNGNKVMPNQYRMMSCYIMQHDELEPHLSLSEYMWMAVNLKLGRGLGYKKRRGVVNGICAILKLTSCRDTRVQNLSGGERKRLAIGLELISNPAIIFLDEPTSGLDSANCRLVTLLLRKLAEQGRTIVCTIHQPPESVFFSFHCIYVLAKGARVLYCDSPSNLHDFLKRQSYPCPEGHNPADFVAEVASERWNDAPLEKMFESTKRAIEMRIGKSHGNRTANVEFFESYFGKGYDSSCMTQFTELFVRSVKLTIRDSDTLSLRFWSAFATALMVGAVYWKIGDDPLKVVDNMAMLFFMLLFVFFAGMMPTLLSFPLEMNIIRREHMNFWYSMKVYYFATTLAFIPAQVLFPTISVTIVYFMTHQPMQPFRYFQVTSILVLLSIFAESYGLIFGCSLAPNSAVFIAPSSAIPFVIFSGFLISLKNVPFYFRWMSSVSFYRYGFEGVMNAVYRSERNFTCHEQGCLFPDSAAIFDHYGIEKDVYHVDAIALFSMTLVIRTAAFFVLWLKLWSMQ